MRRFGALIDRGRLKLGDVVFVAWSDSESSPSWVDPSEIVDRELICYSIGYLALNGEQCIAVATSVDPLNKNYGNVCSIPVSAIRGIGRWK